MPGCAGALEHPHGAPDVDRVAETGVGVDQQRQLDRLGHCGDLVGEFGERDEADIGRSKLHVGDAGAGHVAGPQIRDPRSAVQTGHWPFRGRRSPAAPRGLT